MPSLLLIGAQKGSNMTLKIKTSNNSSSKFISKFNNQINSSKTAAMPDISILCCSCCDCTRHSTRYLIKHSTEHSIVHFIKHFTDHFIEHSTRHFIKHFTDHFNRHFTEHFT